MTFILFFLLQQCLFFEKYCTQIGFFSLKMWAKHYQIVEKVIIYKGKQYRPGASGSEIRWITIQNQPGHSLRDPISKTLVTKKKDW
jgi:hypothetical protein